MYYPLSALFISAFVIAEIKTAHKINPTVMQEAITEESRDIINRGDAINRVSTEKNKNRSYIQTSCLLSCQKGSFTILRLKNLIVMFCGVIRESFHQNFKQQTIDFSATSA